jgi:hypothetical protein
MAMVDSERKLKYCIKPHSPGWPGQNTIYKITRVKRHGSMVEVGEQLPHKCKTLSSSPSTGKKKKRKKKSQSEVGYSGAFYGSSYSESRERMIVIGVQPEKR